MPIKPRPSPVAAGDWFDQFAAPAPVATPRAEPDDWFAQFAAPAPASRALPGPVLDHPATSEEFTDPAPPARSWLDASLAFGKNVAKTLNPLPVAHLAYDAAQAFNPAGGGDAGAGFVADLKGIIAGHVDQYNKANTAFEKGRIAEALGHSVAAAVPFVGPAAATAGEQIAAGDVAGGLGVMTGLLAIPAAKYVGEARLTGSALPTAGRVTAATDARNAATAAAEQAKAASAPPAAAPSTDGGLAAARDFAARHDIPIDAGTATGNRFVQGVQALADTSPIGGVIAQRAKGAVAGRLATVGEQLAAKANQTAEVGPQLPGVTRPMIPGEAVSAEQAGRSAQQAMGAIVQDEQAAAIRAQVGAAEHLDAQGRQLADATHPAAQTPESAGTAAIQGGRDVVHARNVQASDAYGRLREIEADPAHLRTIEPTIAEPRAGSRAMFVTKDQASPSEIYLAAWKDAKDSGFTGSSGELKMAFDEKLKSARALKLESEGTAAEYGPGELLKSIRELGGIKPYIKDYIVGGKAIKHGGEFDSVRQLFNGKGASSLFRENGLGLDDMVGQLRQDPRWAHVLTPETDLIDMLHEIGQKSANELEAAAPTGQVRDLQHYLRGAGVEPGVKWWEQAKAPVDVALPVDLRDVKAAIQPAFNDLKQQADLVPFMDGSGKATAYRALGRLIDGPDHAPLSVVDAALGELKSFARTDNPDLRSIGQGVAAAAIKKLDAVVRQTAWDAGPHALEALDTGRAATVAKYAAADVLKRLEASNAEPVKAFGRLTAKADTNIEHLREVVREVPHAAPQIGRAVIDGILEQKDTAGSFDRAAKRASDWAALGPETKTLLFGGPEKVQALDRLFTTGSKLAEAHGAVAASAAEVVLKRLNPGAAEPVGAFRGMTAAGDADIGHLRDVVRHAPEVAPKIGRAILDGLLNKATDAGGFDHAAAIAASWEKIGPQTKALLYKDPAYVKELDTFFRVAKKAAESPNPSGTALTLHSGGQFALVFTNPAVGIPTVLGSGAVSGLLHSPAGVRLLLKAGKLPKNSLSAARMYAKELTAAAAKAPGTIVAPGLKGVQPSPVAEGDQPGDVTAQIR